MDHNENYIVKTQSFEGPLDLLLSLIEERKLFINEISLASITQDYAQHIENLRNSTQLSGKYYEITGYLVVLATLLLIKSRSLLPNFEITQEEKVTILDLEDRLKIYQCYKEISRDIQKLYAKSIGYCKLPKKRSIVFIPGSEITVEALYSCMQDVLEKKPDVEKELKQTEVQIRKSVSLEEVMERIEKKVLDLQSFTFSSIRPEKVLTKEEKVLTVISFLAILELIRTGILSAEQDGTYGEMHITRQQSQ